ncbi:MAG: hypothetical protein R2873_00465 [Caldilineaceae bacterium]
MNGSNLRDLTDLDRVIHEPARLLIVSYLALVERPTSSSSSTRRI